MLFNAYCTVRALPPRGFAHALVGQRDRSDPELLPHLHGFVGYITQRGTREMTRSLYRVMQHILRVEHQVSLEVDPDGFDGLAAWAAQANAILFLPDGTVRDPYGRVLISPDSAEAQAGAQLPSPPDALARRDRSMANLQSAGIRVPPHLPPVIGEPEAVVRPIEDVRDRVRALFAVALRAESVQIDDRLSAEQIEARLGSLALSPREATFIQDDNPTAQDLPVFGWRYESVTVLLWALGMLDELPPYTGICDVPRVARLMFSSADTLATARLRPTGELLDALDLHYRLHWAVRQARLDELAPPGGIEPGVAYERHYALNWLTGHDRSDWDEVDTPT